METAGKQIYGKKIPLKGFFLILFIFNTFSITSQIISGEIKNEKNEKIEYVNVGIVGTNKGTISDNNGFFSIDISKYSTLDSLYFSHLSYELKKKSVQDVLKKNVFILKQKNIELPEVVLQKTIPKNRVIRKFGIRFPMASSYTSVDYFNQYKDKEIAETGTFLTLKKDYIATNFELKVLSNSCEKVVFRVNFYEVNIDKTILKPLIDKPIYVSVPKTEKSFIISEKINVKLPKGTIWIGLQAVDVKGEKESRFIVPITFSNFWKRINNNFEKFPIGGLPIRIKGYVLE